MLLFASYVSSVTYNPGDIIWSVSIDFDYSAWNLDDSAHAVTVDSTGVYIAGRNLYGLYGYNQWVVEKRTLDSTGGTDGKGLLWRKFVINSNAWPWDIAVDSSGVYVVGSKNNGNMWYVEKRNLNTGVLLWSKDLNFYSDAPPTISEEATGVALDSTGMYVTGHTGGEWRVEKRTLSGVGGTDGKGLLWTKLFTTNIGSSPIPYTVAVDLTGVYIAGKESVTKSIGVTYDWRIEKRALDTGDLIWERRSGLPSGSSAFDLAVDSSGIYISGDGGYTGTGSSYSTWRVEKRTLDGAGGTDGKGLLWSKQEGLSDKSDQPLGLAVDSSGVYLAGEQGFVLTNGLPNPSLGNGLWRVEKRNLATGEVEWFKADDLSPGTVKDTPNDVAVDSSGIYVVGRQSGKDIWRVEKRAKAQQDSQQNCDATILEICSNGMDDNCDGKCDYDSSVCFHGDSACSVGVTGISVSDDKPTLSQSITVRCTSTVAGVNSIDASIDGGGLCSWSSWEGNDAVFTCAADLYKGTGTKIVRCSVNTDKSYKTGSDQTKSIEVKPDSCVQYTDASSCDQDNRCKWCTTCDVLNPKHYTGISNKCVDKKKSCPPPTPYCSKGVCGATCDSTQGGCSASQTCDLNSCSCVCSPQTCDSLSCGVWDDGCGGTLNCGACTLPTCTTKTDCPSGAECVDGVCGCPFGTSFCGDGTCKADCGGVPPFCVDNGVCEAGEGCGCVDCRGDADSCLSGNVCYANTDLCNCGFGLKLCADGSCSSSCTTPACSVSADCPSGAECKDGVCGCPGGTDLCGDGTCSSSCGGDDYKGCLNSNGVCDWGEGCHCVDCSGQQASCVPSGSCVNDFCSECVLSNANWNVSNCGIVEGNEVCVVGSGVDVSLNASGSSSCVGRVFDFRITLKDEVDVEASVPGVFADGFVVGSWNSVWKDASWLPGGQDPVYGFSLVSQGVSVSSGNFLRVCENDGDCDGVVSGKDQCDGTQYGNGVDGVGCDPEQANCISYIDCTDVAWSECNSANQKTRNICKGSDANPLTCCNNPETCACTFNDGMPQNCKDNDRLSSWIPTSRECLIEKEFPFFSTISIIIVLVILAGYYFFVQIKKKKAKRKR